MAESLQGLSDAEAGARLLFGGGGAYLALGDLKEAIILLVFASMSVTITTVQELRTSLPLFWSRAAGLFGFGPLHWDDLVVTAGGAALIYALLEAAKRFLGRRFWA